MAEKGNISINTDNIFPIIKKWLYSDRDIFLREIVSNACDAGSKLKKLSSMGEIDGMDVSDLRITVSVNEEEKTLKVMDKGIGMTEDEVKKYINQIAFSGAKDFLEKYKDKTDEDNIIGHFGLGFYSVFMVADKVSIETLSCQAGAKAVRWTSEGGMDYEIEDSDKEDVGTCVTLYLSEDCAEYSKKYKALDILEKYCSFLPFEIYLVDEKAAEEEEKADDKAEKDQPEKNEDGSDEKKEEPKPINDTKPLWLKNPSDCTDEEYKDFFRKVFKDYNEPLFWIHLNMDYPFNLKGILFFPKVNPEYQNIEGQIKLFCNQVFVADNIKEVIPEFLMLLKGTIDCPDLPLNVSRSFLQNDGYVNKISSHIIKKVADKINGLFNVDRENYEKYWEDINPFIKYGCMKEEKFFDRVKDSLIFKAISDGKYVTLDEYKDRVSIETKEFGENEADEADTAGTAGEAGAEAGSKAETAADAVDTAEAGTDASAADTAGEADTGAEAAAEEKSGDEEKSGTEAKPEAKLEEENVIVYYVTDERIQAQYIKMFQDNGMEAVLLTEAIDNPFANFLEYKNAKRKMVRIDSDLSETFKSEESDEKDDKKIVKALEKIFKTATGNDNLKVEAQSLKTAEVPSIIMLSEESRRMQEMAKMYGTMGMDPNMFPLDEKLVLNTSNPLIKKLAEMAKDKTKKDEVNMMSAHVYDIAMMSHKQMSPQDMTKFIERSNRILEVLANKIDV